MKIRIYQGHRPSMEQADVCVAIDVIRAFTTTAVAFARGVDDIVLVGEVAGAFDLAERYPEYLLAGERDGLKVDGFDLGNSPAEFAQADLTGRGIILTTTNGVRAALHARARGTTLVCGYRTADSVARWIRNTGCDSVNLLASHPDGDEDIACAEYLAGQLAGGGPGPGQVEQRIRNSHAAAKFLDTDRTAFDPRDVEYCATRVDDGPVMVVEERADVVALRAVTPPSPAGEGSRETP
jgi:2-phosphosulfolactate phosphatase